MRMKPAFLMGPLLLFAFGAVPMWSQSPSDNAPFTGVVVQDKEPVSGAQIVLTNPDTGKQYKTKTDKKGEYVILGVTVASYKIVVISSDGEVLYVNNGHVIDGKPFRIDLSKPEASGGAAGQGVENARRLKEQMAEETAKVASLNALVMEAQNAMRAQKWTDAERALTRLIEAYPETTRWELYKALGDAEGRLEKYQDAVRAYERGIQLAQAVTLGTAPDDPRNPNPDPTRAAAGLSQMLITQGNDYAKLNKVDEAVACFKRAADTNANPAIAYYNLCAVEFNFNRMDDAVAACDKSVAANPGNAEAWFLKGSALYKTGKTENGKVEARPGTVEALNKYLQLDPNGAHASEVKSILEALGQN